MLWEEQSWPNIKEIDKNTPVVIPTGSCEQHGHHLPVFVDSIQVDGIARRSERELGDAVLLLPTLWLGSSHHHLDFPGTVSVPPALYSQMIKSVATCVLEAKFHRILFLNGHGGNHVPIAHALSELAMQSDEANAALLALATWWELGRTVVNPDHLDTQTPCLTHACEYETSLVMALRPDLVALDRAVEGSPALDNDWVRTESPGSRVAIFQRFNRLTAAGSMGRPTAASAEKGQRLLDGVVDEVVKFVRDFATWPELSAVGPR